MVVLLGGSGPALSRLTVVEEPQPITREAAVDQSQTNPAVCMLPEGVESLFFFKKRRSTGQNGNSQHSNFSGFLLWRNKLADVGLTPLWRFSFYSNARLVKLVDTGDLKSPTARCAGSIPVSGTRLIATMSNVNFDPIHLRMGIKTSSAFDGVIPVSPPDTDYNKEVVPVPDVNATLQERGSRYGRFAEQAIIGFHLRETMHSAPNWRKLGPFQQEALDTICSKIARILNGDPTYLDNWHDIAGYATLVERILKGENP